MRSIILMLTCLIVMLPLSEAQVTDEAKLSHLAERLFVHNELFWLRRPDEGVFTLSFEKLLDNHASCLKGGENCAIDWDFWTDSQDRESLKFLSVIKVSVDKSHATVVIRYVCDCGARGRLKLRATVLFEKVSGRWLVADILRRHRSVYNILEAFSKQQQQ